MRKLVLIVILVLALPKLGFSQAEKYKSVFTQNFIRYIGWTDQSKQGDFVIGVLKSSTIAGWLKKQSAGKKFGFQNVVVKEFKNVEEVSKCQVLYVSSAINFSKYSAAIFSKLGKGSLVVTEAEGATDHGSIINFVIRGNNLKFEISESNAAKQGLSISSKLSTLPAAIKK